MLPMAEGHETAAGGGQAWKCCRQAIRLKQQGIFRKDCIRPGPGEDMGIPGPDRNKRTKMREVNDAEEMTQLK